jgi:ATP/maltotriose-dependent transcriptional regulator MalT
MPLAEEIGNELFRALGTHVRATTAYLRGDIPTATRLAEEALDALRADGVPAAALSMAMLAMCAVHDGRMRAAASYAEEALTTAVAAHNAGLEARAREALAAVRVTQGDTAAAAQLLREAVVLRAERTRPTEAVEAADVLWSAEQCREHLASEEFAALSVPAGQLGGAQATS